jgi:hypothetical protein
MRWVPWDGYLRQKEEDADAAWLRICDTQLHNMDIPSRTTGRNYNRLRTLKSSASSTSI